ncbi:immunoglobulin-like domain-containing protein [Planococcus sp. NCCP-2050]|uniref:immunoglobulin-like domain-containing protein n=1 Tax=Planococcus sp. NCCP-2050 TaxID=2944679 RepID=UPI00203EE3DF|nr:immunoglobulin-like domain-containing protein [Planococcus sp. NCCP-2050]GKW46933.1 hypothetical protein NCCP2050_26250 [Planococcus sp. NCCP-2050]
MKKGKRIIGSLLAFIAILFCFYLLTVAPAQERPSSNEEFSVEMEQREYPATAKELTILIQAKAEGATGGDYLFLEKKRFGTWCRFPLKEEAANASLTTFSIHEASPKTLPVDLLKNELTPGEYRAVYGSVAAPFSVVE